MKYTERLSDILGEDSVKCERAERFILTQLQISDVINIVAMCADAGNRDCIDILDYYFEKQKEINHDR